MNNKSRKQKGRRLQNHVRDRLLKAFPHLKAEDIKVAIMSEPGPDIKLSRIAKKLIPYQWECKNQEKLNLWKAWEQTQSNADEYQPLLIVGKNNTRPLAASSLKNHLKGLEI